MTINAYQQMRMDRIRADLAQYYPVVSPRPVVVVGDSDTFNCLLAFPAGFTINGHPIVFAGISGGTYEIIHECFSPVQPNGKTLYQMIEDAQPHAIIPWLGVNDAMVGASGCDTNGNVKASYLLSAVMPVLTKLNSITSNIIVGTSPPPDVSAYSYGVEPYRLHQFCRVLHYLVNGGGSPDPSQPVPWSAWGWPNAGIGKKPFVDIYSLLAQQPANPPTLAWNGTGALMPALWSIDQTHPPSAGYVTAVNAFATVI